MLCLNNQRNNLKFIIKILSLTCLGKRRPEWWLCAHSNKATSKLHRMCLTACIVNRADWTACARMLLVHNKRDSLQTGCVFWFSWIDCHHIPYLSKNFYSGHVTWALGFTTLFTLGLLANRSHSHMYLYPRCATDIKLA